MRQAALFQIDLRAGHGRGGVGGGQQGAGAGIEGHQARVGPGGARCGLGIRAYLGNVDGLSGAGVGQPQVGDGALDVGLLEGVGGRKQVLASFQRQMFKPLLPGELGMAHVHHHHARQEPQEEQQACADAQPAVAEQDPAFDAGEVHRHPWPGSR